MPLWLWYSLLSAMAAAMVSIFGKIGMRDVDPNLATAVRSIVMTIVLGAVCSTMGLWNRVPSLSARSLTMIALSGSAGAISWLFYFRALQIGTVSQVGPVDKISMPLAVVLATLLLGERPRAANWLGITLVAAGAYLAAMPPRPS